MRMGTIMGSQQSGWGAHWALRWGALGAVAVGAAACSSETTRFAQDGTPYPAPPPAYQAAPVQPAPAAQIERQPLPQYQSPPPSPQPAADVTGTVPSSAGGHWDWQGGTPIVVAQGETIATIARRHNVP